MVCASTIIQRILIKINVEEGETSDGFMEITDTAESEAPTWQQTNSISIAISIGIQYKIFYTFHDIFIYLFIFDSRKISLFGYYLSGWSS